MNQGIEPFQRAHLFEKEIADEKIPLVLVRGGGPRILIRDALDSAQQPTGKVSAVKGKAEQFLEVAEAVVDPLVDF